MKEYNCRLCKTKAEYIGADKLEEDYYHCPECDLIFMREEDIISTDAEKKRYEEHDNNHENEGYVRMFEDFIDRAIEPFFDFDDELIEGLEFGCGPGPVLADLLENKGVEIDRYDPYFFPETDYYNNQYDLITSTEVFEHLKTPDIILEKLQESLKEGGIISLMTHFHQKGQEDFNFEDWWYKWDSTHITFYSHKTIKWIAAEFGFEILYLGEKKLCVLANIEE